MKTLVAAALLSLLALPASAAELTRAVRLKISAGDLASGIAAVEDYERATGVDAEYLDAVGWLARGALILGRLDLARQYVAQLHAAIPAETDALLVPYGAAIEVEGRLLAETGGRGTAIRYFEERLAQAKAASLRSRISKNINLLSLEGQPAPRIDGVALAKGKPALLYFFAEWCGDCRAQAPALERIWKTYGPQGLQLAAVTRLYGGPAAKPMTPEEERARLTQVWKQTYAGLEGIAPVVDTDAMVRYGASATPTFALIDRRGVVRLYTPTRLSETDLSRRIEALLSE